MIIDKQKKKLVAGAVAGVAALALIGGGTFALWSDFDTVTGGEVGAGTLTLTAEGAGVSGVEVGKLVPGGGVDNSFAVATNADDSDVSGRLTVTLTGLVDDPDTCSSTNSEAAVDDCEEGGPGDLSAEAVGVMSAKAGPCGGSGVFAVVNPASALENYENFSVDTGLDLAPGDEACVKFTVSLPAGATDASQGDSATFGARFDIAQTVT
ncbi:TasA family protein [Pseudonocardia sp.]|uniref:TasA family protein n=1 Tax=Pseudonocardia sp. TaxID=60912 RepID=UPI0026140348|nr:TasA family protein [Pseudonocardia sp.]